MAIAAAAPGEDVQEEATAAAILAPPGLRANIRRLQAAIVPHTAILLQTKLLPHGVLEALQQRTVKPARKPRQLLAHTEQLWPMAERRAKQKRPPEVLLLV